MEDEDSTSSSSSSSSTAGDRTNLTPQQLFAQSPSTPIRSVSRQPVVQAELQHEVVEVLPAHLERTSDVEGAVLQAPQGKIDGDENVEKALLTGETLDVSDGRKDGEFEKDINKKKEEYVNKECNIL